MTLRVGRALGRLVHATGYLAAVVAGATSKFLLESGTYGYLLEDGSGVLLMES